MATRIERSASHPQRPLTITATGRPLGTTKGEAGVTDPRLKSPPDRVDGIGVTLRSRCSRAVPRAIPRAIVLCLCAVLALAGWGVAAPVASADTAFTFTGGGWGHGVGMCQWGARGRAEAGQSAGAILRAYYPGAAPRRLAL